MSNNETYDVVIIGGGASGFAAAYESAKKGLKTLIIEQGRNLGGSGNYIEGIFAINSYLQKKYNDVNLTKQYVVNEELDYSHYEADANTWGQYVDHSAAMIKWLHDLGVKYIDVLPLGSGKRTWHLFKGRGKAAINDVLVPKAKEAGADIRTSTAAKKLLIDNKGHVNGVELYSFVNKKIYDVNAKNVIIATGGYLNNKEMIGHYTRYDKDRLIPVNSNKNDGTGLEMAWKVGAQRYHMGMAMLFGGYIKDPDEQPYKYRFSELNGTANQQSLLWVNETGRRFVNEEVNDNFALAGNVLFTQSKLFTILDQATIDHLAEKGLYKPMGTWGFQVPRLEHLKDEINQALKAKKQYLTKADTIEELAKKLNLKDLPATIARYNDLCKKGKDEDYGKSAKFMIPVEKGPFYAVEQGVGAFCTMGGLKVNLKNQVLDKSGYPIEGLYAVGNEAAGMLVGDTYGPNMPGSDGGYAFFSGKHTADVIANK